MWPRTPKDIIDHLIPEYSTSLVCVNQYHYLFWIKQWPVNKIESKKSRCGNVV